MSNQPKITGKPCPFCGSHRLDVSVGGWTTEGYPAWIVCLDCDAYGPREYVFALPNLQPEITAKWNKRIDK